jgi:CubicO group peptidase (beta-lactamase class C family)
MISPSRTGPRTVGRRAVWRWVWSATDAWSLLRPGVADIASRTPVIEDTVFRVGLLTNTFTAIAVMQLEEHGLVKLGRAGQRLPERSPTGPKKSPLAAGHRRNLFTHTAGIREVLHLSGAAWP